MTKIKSGLILIAVGIGLNIFGRLVATFAPTLMASLPITGTLALLMVASVVLVLFGIFRLIVGLVSKKEQAKTSSAMSVDNTVWPPAPKPPDTL